VLTQQIRDAVELVASRPEIIETVQRIYEELAEEIAKRRPVCEMSGRCCRFEEYGHRLYVTTIELGAFVAGVRQGGAIPRDWGGTGCPFQLSKFCSVHAIRPFGCRVFFCDPTATQWQNGQYEHFHGKLKALHEQTGVPYFYVEWREGLRIVFPELSQTPVTNAVGTLTGRASAG
jgi:Fe-S-cluster containining protein